MNDFARVVAEMKEATTTKQTNKNNQFVQPSTVVKRKLSMSDRSQTIATDTLTCPDFVRRNADVTKYPEVHRNDDDEVNKEGVDAEEPLPDEIHEDAAPVRRHLKWTSFNQKRDKHAPTSPPTVDRRKTSTPPTPSKKTKQPAPQHMTREIYEDAARVEYDSAVGSYRTSTLPSPAVADAARHVGSGLYEEVIPQDRIRTRLASEDHQQLTLIDNALYAS